MAGMARLSCPCGNELSSVQYPNDCIADLVPQRNGDNANGQEAFSFISRNSRQVWECDKCGRLAIDDPAGDGRQVLWYKPESAAYSGVCKEKPLESA